MGKAFLYPKQGYVPKIPTNIPGPIVLQLFCPPPFKDSEQETLNLMCPVRALDTYVHRSSLTASKPTVSKWIVKAISLAYEVLGHPSPLSIRARFTTVMAASKALLSGVSIKEVCDAAGWSSPLTFVRFYGLDVDTPGSRVLMP